MEYSDLKCIKTHVSILFCLACLLLPIGLVLYGYAQLKHTIYRNTTCTVSSILVSHERCRTDKETYDCYFATWLVVYEIEMCNPTRTRPEGWVRVRKRRVRVGYGYKVVGYGLEFFLDYTRGNLMLLVRFSLEVINQIRKYITN